MRVCCRCARVARIVASTSPAGYIYGGCAYISEYESAERGRLAQAYGMVARDVIRMYAHVVAFTAVCVASNAMLRVAFGVMLRSPLKRRYHVTYGVYVATVRYVVAPRGLYERKIRRASC